MGAQNPSRMEEWRGGEGDRALWGRFLSLYFSPSSLAPLLCVFPESQWKEGRMGGQIGNSPGYTYRNPNSNKRGIAHSGNVRPCTKHCWQRGLPRKTARPGPCPQTLTPRFSNGAAHQRTSGTHWGQLTVTTAGLATSVQRADTSDAVNITYSLSLIHI